MRINEIIALLLTVLCYCARIHSSSITFSSTKKIVRNLNDFGIDSSSFSTWFSDKKRPIEVLNLNPGICKIMKIDDNKYQGYLNPITFPGLSITSVVTFDTVFDGKRLEVNCFDDSLVQEYQGSKLLIALVSNLIPKIKSTNILSINDDNYLINEATLNIYFTIPKWFPLKKEILEEKGSEAIGKNIESDLNNLLDKIIEVFKRSA